MARRSDHNKVELKQMAIDAGYFILENQGIEALSARKVAGEIGYTVGTIYNIFETHDLFLLHIQGKVLDHWFDSLEIYLKDHQETVSLLDLAKFYLQYSQDHIQTWSILFHQPRKPNEALPEWYQDKMNRLFTLLQDVISPCVGGDTTKAHLASRVLWSSIHGICILSLSGKLDIVDAKGADILIENLITTYLKGLKS